MFKIFKSKEQSPLKLAIKNDTTKIPKEFLQRIKQMEKDLVANQTLNKEIISLIESKLRRYEYLKLIFIVYILIRDSINNPLITKLITNSISFTNQNNDITNTNSQEKDQWDELLSILANHLDKTLTLIVNDCGALDKSISIEEIFNLYSENDCDETILSLIHKVFQRLLISTNYI